MVITTEKVMSDIIYSYFGKGWNKKPEYSCEVRENFDKCAKKILSILDARLNGQK